VGWRRLFELLAIVSAGCAILIYLVVPEPPAVTPVAGEPAANGLSRIYAEPRFWRLAPLSATCVGTAWAFQGLWAAPWLSDVEGLDRTELLRYLLVMAIALSMGALLLGVTSDRLLRQGAGPKALLGLVTAIFIMAQLTLILRLPVPSYLPWSVIAAVGAMTVLSYTILAEYFPRELAGRANAALNVFHIGGAFVLQYLTGMVLQLWTPLDGHYPAVAYQAAFALNVVFQIAAGIWFALPWLLKNLRSQAVNGTSDLNRQGLTARSGCEFKMPGKGAGSL
jgi:predicted MFS family arabinose efflux permease